MKQATERASNKIRVVVATSQHPAPNQALDLLARLVVKELLQTK